MQLKSEARLIKKYLVYVPSRAKVKRLARHCVLYCYLLCVIYLVNSICKKNYKILCQSLLCNGTVTRSLIELEVSFGVSWSPMA